MTARELAEEYCRNGIVVSVAGIEALILKAIEMCAREVVDGCPTTKAAGSCCAGCDHAATRVQALAGPVSREPG